ncbi:MAG: hypothetical protein KAY24_13775 [Candidatus Eisenbacteria sp.]|nr:hypothetical protein [Candidatus Eisenbacteria bacterium]
MRNLVCIFGVAAILGLGVHGCSEYLGPADPAAPDRIAPITMAEPCGDPTVVSLLLRGRTDIGSVTATNDEDSLYVEIATMDGWVMIRSCVAVALSPEFLPHQSWGNRMTRPFEYASAHDHLTEFVYAIPLDEGWYEMNQDLYISVYVIVESLDMTSERVRRQMAWVESGRSFEKGRGRYFRDRERYFVHTVQSCSPGCGCMITVVCPNGGEYHCANQWMDIMWDSDGEECGAFVSIDLLHDGEICLTVISSTANTGYYGWDEAGQCGGAIDGYTVLVTDLESGASDESDGSFMIDLCPE